MKLQAISSVNGVTKNYNTNSVQKTKKQDFSAPQNYPQNIISFKGNNSDHVIFVCAELKNWLQNGGVATVAFDYANMDKKQGPIVMPYYNGHLKHDSEGKYADSVTVHKFPEGHEHAGKTFATNADLTTTPLENIYNNPKQYVLIDEIAKKTLPWDSSKSATLYRMTDQKAINGINRDIFLVYTDSLAVMPKPYAEGSYSTKTAKQVGEEATKAAFKPQPYAEFCRMYVDFEDEIINNTRTTDGSKFSPMTVSCSDAQTAYIPYYMRKKGIEDHLPIYTLHNGGDGYTGQTSGRVLFQNLLIAENETTYKQTLNNLKHNPEFIEHMMTGTTEEFFKKYLPQFIDDSGSFNPTFIPFMYNQKKDGYVKGINSVSQPYVEGLAFNENIRSGIQKYFKSLYKDGQAIGILNPMNDPEVSGFEDSPKIGPDGKILLNNKGEPIIQKRGYLDGYNREITIKYKDGTTETIAPFKRFQESFFKNAAGETEITEATLKHVDEVKLDNQINFLKRFSGFYDSTEFKDAVESINFDNSTLKHKAGVNLIIGGKANKNMDLIGHIDPEMIRKFEAAKEGKGTAPKIFVSWGRIDDQKALDSVMNAFERFLKTNPDAILVLGGPPLPEKDGSYAACTKKVLTQAADMVEKEHIKGKMVFIPEFAPGKVLAGIADAAVFPSRFAPCELTDLESMKYLLRVIATNCQGLAGKNFDATMDGAENATGYKTIHEFFGITEKTIKEDNEVIKLFLKGDNRKYITGFEKLYQDAETEYLTKTGNSNISYRSAIVTNLENEVKGVLNEDALNTAKEKITTLMLNAEEQTKLNNIPGLTAKEIELFKKIEDTGTPTEKTLISKLKQGITFNEKELEKLTKILDATDNKNVFATARSTIMDAASGKIYNMNDKALLSKFASNKKLTQSEISKIITLINAENSIDNALKTRFIELINGTTQANVEKELFNLILTPTNLGNKDIILNGGAITDNEISLLKTYLADVNQMTRKAVDDSLIVTGKMDESQLSVLKRIFQYDPVLNFLHDQDKYKNKYADLIDTCRNTIIEKELSICMQRCAEESPVGRLQMLKNHYLMNTTWNGNAKLTNMTRTINGVPNTPVSSLYLYEEMFKRTRTEEQKKVGFTDFLQNLMDAIKPATTNKGSASGSSTNNALTNAAEDAVKKSAGMSKGMKIALGAGAALLALGGAFYVMNKSGSKTNEHGDKFQPSTQTNKAPNNTAATKANNPAQKGANPAQKQPALNPYLATK